jgi:serine/threonine protein kinase
MVNGGESEEQCTRASLLGRYEVGRTLGEGNFGKVKYARHRATGGHFAIKLLDRDKILSQRIDDQASITHEQRFSLPPSSYSDPLLTDRTVSFLVPAD